MTYTNDNTLLISAYFADLQLSEMGGRSRHLAECKYLPSLKSIKKTSTPMTIWIDERYAETYHQQLYRWLQEAYQREMVLVYNLYTSAYYDTIRKLKVERSINSYGEQRSYDFCINKLKMISNSLDIYKDEFEYYWWIDAGLSYEVLYPYKYFPLIEVENHLERFSECDLMSPTLIQNLNALTEDKVTVFMINRPEHWVNVEEIPEYYTLGKTIIGGLFGGSRQAMQNLFAVIIPMVEGYLNKGQLYLEEVYLTLCYIHHPELFNVCAFDTWYSVNQKHALDSRGMPPKGKGFYHWIETLAGFPESTYETLENI